MGEVIFVVEEAPEGGFVAKVLGGSIFARAETMEQLKENINEAVESHFDPESKPKIIRLQSVK